MNVHLTYAVSGERAAGHPQGLFHLFIQYKEDIFLTNCLYSLAMLYCFKYAKNICVGVNILYFLALRFACCFVCWKNKRTICSEYFGHYEVVPMFSSPWHVAGVFFFSFNFIYLYLLSLLLAYVYLYVYSQCLRFCFLSVKRLENYLLHQPTS